MTGNDQALINTRDMLAVHQAFRRAFGAAPALVASVAEGDTERCGTVATFYDNVLRFLDVHHAGEEELVLPRLIERCPDHSKVIGDMIAQHQAVIVDIAAAEAAIGSWVPSASRALGDEVAAALVRLGDDLGPHLDEEEADLLPIAAANMTQEEWGQLPAHGFAGFKGDKIWLILGLIRENMTAEQRDEMLANMPPPAVEMWNGFGSQAFDDFVAALDRPE